MKYIKDQKGYEYRSMGWQDVLVVSACSVAAVALAVILIVFG